MEPITARFNWTVDDLILGRKTALKAEKTSHVGVMIFGMVAVITGFVAISGDLDHPFSAVALGITVGILILYLPL